MLGWQPVGVDGRKVLPAKIVNIYALFKGDAHKCLPHDSGESTGGTKMRDFTGEEETWWS